jgi:hypothetical protein
MRVRSDRNTKGASETKIGQFELPLAVDEQVWWLQITVQDTVVMAVGNASQELVEETLEDRQVEA